MEKKFLSEGAITSNEIAGHSFNPEKLSKNSTKTNIEHQFISDKSLKNIKRNFNIVTDSYIKDV